MIIDFISMTLFYRRNGWTLRNAIKRAWKVSRNA